MDNNQIPTPIQQPSMPTNGMANPLQGQQDNKKHTGLLIAVIIIGLILVSAAVIIIATMTRQQTPSTDNGQQGQQQEKPGEVTGYDPGHPLPDNEDLDKDRSSEYTDALKIFIKVGQLMQYKELEQLVKGISTKCNITQYRDLGTIECGGADKVRFAIDENNDNKTTSYYNYTNSFTEDAVVYIRDLGEGKYEFGNDALIGQYSNKNRAINAYLYYAEQYGIYSKKIE